MLFLRFTPVKPPRVISIRAKGKMASQLLKLEPLKPLKPFPTLARREHMIESQLRQRGIRDQRVLGAMNRVPATNS